MKVTIPAGKIQGNIAAIPSKSHLHRVLICAALADKETIINSPKTEAEDIKATIGCLEALGAKITETPTGFTVSPIQQNNLPKKCILPCNESGSTYRFMLPVVAALGVEGTFRLAGRLPQRPMAPLDTELMKHGITFSKPEPNLLCCQGQLQAGDYVLPGDISSQYITGLVLALPLLKGDSKLTVLEPVESEDYITLTLKVAEDFGQKHQGRVYNFSGEKGFTSPGEINAEGDWSNAAFWLCAGAMPGGHINLSGMSKDSTQGDKEICDILYKMGANVTWQPSGVLTVTEGKREGIEIDARAIPDLVPVLAAVAAVSEGETVFKNAGRLRLKESDRIKTTVETLKSLGADITELTDGLTVTGKPTLKGGTTVDSWGDHRIAMMAAIASAACEKPVTITGAEAVNKSYPKFWDDIAVLGKKVDTKNGGQK